mgnify:CR=1
MTKKWTYEEYKFALNSAWSAFESTLKAHEVTTEEIKKFKYLADSSLVKVDDYFAQSITWEEE